MPNSRVEVASSVSSEDIEDAGGWLTSGNNLGAGAGSKLGSKDNFKWTFITNNIVRGAFDTDGGFYLVENEIFSDREYKFLPRSTETNDLTPQTMYSFNITNRRIFSFHVDMIYLNADNTTYGKIERSVIFHRLGGVPTLSKETHHTTEKVGNKNVNMFFEHSGNLLELKVQGLAGENIKYSGMIKFHGLLNL